MPFPIQRVPRGLNELLSLQSGRTPQALEETVRGSLDLLQFYSWQQRTVLTASNAAIAEGAPLAVPIQNSWMVLVNASLRVTKTATMTALRASIFISTNAYATQELGPFGATETGNARMNFFPTYPMIIAPGTGIFAIVDIIGTDATANVAFSIDVGILG